MQYAKSITLFYYLEVIKVILSKLDCIIETV